MKNLKKEKYKIEAQAEKYIKKGKVREAIEEYRKLLTGEGEQDIPVLNVIGDLYVRSNQIDKAIKEFQKIASVYEEKKLYYKSIAINKKITRLNPRDVESAKRLADLFFDQGFVSEAKMEYQGLAKRLEEENKIHDATLVYERLLKIDPENTQFRLNVAELYKSMGSIDQAVERFNDVVENKIRHKAFIEAGEILNRIKTLKADHPRTLGNILGLLKAENRNEEALDLTNEILQKDKNNLRALNFLANVHYENNEFNEAKSIFSRIVSVQPDEVEARFKLGRIYIHENLLDKTFELYEPLIGSFLRKHRVDKAVGLLGLILSKKSAHFPTLEKLAEIYKAENQKESYELIYRLILAEARRDKLKDKMILALDKLVNSSPENKEYYSEYRQLKRELGILGEEQEAGLLSVDTDDIDKIIDSNISKADLYIDQGLIRNAKRILDNLRVKFPEDARISRKIADLKEISPEVEEQKIPERVEKAIEKESQLFSQVSEKTEGITPPFSKEATEEKKITAADIFSDTDITPFISEEGKRKYYDLNERIIGELQAISSVLNYQISGGTITDEKGLGDIVAEFKRDIREKVAEENYESHYNLGIAFKEQGMFDEAIEGFQLASKDQKLRIECYELIGSSYKEKMDFQEALKWIEKALESTEGGSRQSFALKYEQASIFEEMRDSEKAINLYREISDWNDNYRDVAHKIKKLEKLLKK